MTILAWMMMMVCAIELKIQIQYKVLTLLLFNDIQESSIEMDPYNQ